MSFETLLFGAGHPAVEGNSLDGGGSGGSDYPVRSFLLDRESLTWSRPNIDGLDAVISLRCGAFGHDLIGIDRLTVKIDARNALVTTLRQVVRLGLSGLGIPAMILVLLTRWPLGTGHMA